MPFTFRVACSYTQNVASHATIEIRGRIYLPQNKEISRVSAHREREVSTMKKGLTEIVFILDRSGSMSLSKQKKEVGEALISTVLFDDQTEILHDRKNIDKVEQITDKEYYVGGCTALLDAVGGAIHHISHIQKEMPEEEKPEKTLFIITTDGMENASKKYSYDKVKKMVEKRKKKDHWEFVFLGANIDAVEVAGRFGVAADRAVRYECDAEGTALNWTVMSDLVSCARAAGSAVMMEKAFGANNLLAPIQKDYQKRHRA